MQKDIIPLLKMMNCREKTASAVIAPDVKDGQVFQVTPCFLYDTKGMFANNASFIIPDADEYLLGYSNSALSWFMIQKYCSSIQNGFQLMSAYFEKTLIFPASDKQKIPVIKHVQSILANPDSTDIPHLEKDINKLVYKLYNLTPEEIAIVEGDA